MNDINKKLISEIPEERKATPEESWNMQGVLGTTLLGNIVFSPIDEKSDVQEKNTVDIQKYLIPFPKRKDREYNPDLDNARASMEKNNEKGNDIGTLQDIDYILQNYQKSLSFDDAIEIYFFLIHTRLEKNTQENRAAIDETLTLVDHIQPYEHQLNSQQKDYFWYYVGITCFCKGALNQENIYYERANTAFDRILNANRTNMHTGNIAEHMLDTERYKEILHYKIHSLYHLHEYEKVLPIIMDFFEVCGRDPIEKSYNDPRDKQRISQILYIQGDAYEMLHEYDNAIESYQNYSFFEPKDEFVQKNIALLKSKKSPE
ncbi:MAG: hypothetical protein WC606_01265 [Candidatus Absconditabacterales bacterium]